MHGPSIEVKKCWEASPRGQKTETPYIFAGLWGKRKINANKNEADETNNMFT